MLKMKANYKKGQKDLKYENVKKETETWQNILEECRNLHKEEGTKVTKEDIFKKDIHHQSKVAAKIENIMNKIEKKYRKKIK